MLKYAPGPITIKALNYFDPPKPSLSQYLLQVLRCQDFQALKSFSFLPYLYLLDLTMFIFPYFLFLLSIYTNQYGHRSFQLCYSHTFILFFTCIYHMDNFSPQSSGWLVCIDFEWVKRIYMTWISTRVVHASTPQLISLQTDNQPPDKNHHIAYQQALQIFQTAEKQSLQ